MNLRVTPSFNTQQIQNNKYNNKTNINFGAFKGRPETIGLLKVYAGDRLFALFSPKSRSSFRLGSISIYRLKKIAKRYPNRLITMSEYLDLAKIKDPKAKLKAAIDLARAASQVKIQNVRKFAYRNRIEVKMAELASVQEALVNDLAKQ